MFFKKSAERLHSQAHKLFLLDGLGALLSAFLIGVVLVKFNSLFGIPISALYFLALLPCLFAMYDFYCYQKKNINTGLSLKIIAVVNVLYCCLSLGLAFYHREEITVLGWGYIIVEIVIVLVLAKLEFEVGERLLRNKKNNV